MKASIVPHRDHAGGVYTSFYVHYSMHKISGSYIKMIESIPNERLTFWHAKVFIQEQNRKEPNEKVPRFHFFTYNC